MRRVALSTLAMAALAAAGCASIGPKTLPRDRFEYSTGLAESWKRQTLLNIVKIRYLEPPLFVDVGQIVAGYSLETGVSVGGQLSSDTAVQGRSIASIGGSGKYTDRPTIVYTPLTGNKFIRDLMTPLRPDSVFMAILSGLQADAVLFSALSSINGLQNQSVTVRGVVPPDPGFIRALELLRAIQLSGSVGLRLRTDPGGRSTTVVSFAAQDMSEETRAQAHELRRLLKLDPDRSEFDLVSSAVQSSEGEIAVQTRSMLKIMSVLSGQVDVPAEHVAEGRTVAGFDSLGAEAGPRMIRVQCTAERPEDAFVAVEFRDHWFWIDDRDIPSKRTLSFMMLFFTMVDSGSAEKAAVLTIPAQ